MSEEKTLEKIEESKAIVQQGHQTPFNISDGVQLLDVEQQEIFLTEFKKRRDHFRKWLMEQLTEGIHFGFPPGCRAKYDENGNALVYHKGKYVKLDPRQWQHKASLYKAGALYLKELLKLRDEYHSDLDAWQMMGEPKGVLVRTCKLINPANGEILGEGTGSFKVNEKGMNENSTIKMADKCAVVAAVINTLAIGDLFTQDIEDKPPKDKSTHLSPEMEKDFYEMVREWVADFYKKDKVMADYQVKDLEIKALRTNISIWCKGKIPKSAKAALEWCQLNTDIKTTENEEGEITGIKFVRKQNVKS